MKKLLIFFIFAFNNNGLVGMQKAAPDSLHLPSVRQKSREEGIIEEGIKDSKSISAAWEFINSMGSDVLNHKFTIIQALKKLESGSQGQICARLVIEFPFSINDKGPSLEILNEIIKDMNLGTKLLLLWHVVVHNKENIVSILLADSEITANNCSFALMDAAQNGNFEITKMLLDKGADAKSDYGVKALWKAVKYDAPASIVTLLLDHGADPTRKSKTGHTVLDFARTVEVRDLIKEALAQLPSQKRRKVD